MGPKKGKKKSNKKNNQGDTGGGGGDDSIPPTPIEGETPQLGELPETPIDQTGDSNGKPNGTADLGDVHHAAKTFDEIIPDVERDTDAIRSGDEQEKEKLAEHNGADEPTDPTVLPEEPLDGVEKPPVDGDQVDPLKFQEQQENHDEDPQLVSEEAPAAVDHVPDTVEPGTSGADDAHDAPAPALEEVKHEEVQADGVHTEEAKPEEGQPEEVKPEDLADAAPEHAPEEAVAPEAAPTDETPVEAEAAPEAAPQVAPEGAPEGAPEETREAAPIEPGEVASEVTPEVVHEVSEAAPDTTAEVAPEAAVEATAPEEAPAAEAPAPEIAQEAPQESAEPPEPVATLASETNGAPNELPPTVATPPAENALSTLKSLTSPNPNFSASRYLSVHSPTFTGRPHHTVDSSHDLDSRNMTSSFNNWYNKVYTLADSLEFSKGWPDVEAFDLFASALDQPFKQISMWPPEEFFARKPREEDPEPLEGDDLKYEQFWEWKSKIALAAFCSNFAAREVMGRQLFALTPDEVKRLGSAMFVFAKDLEDEITATRFRQMTVKLLFESTSYKKAAHKELQNLSKELGNVISPIVHLLPPPAESSDKPPADRASSLNSMIMTTIGTPSAVLHNTIQKDPVYFALYHPTPGQAFDEDLMEETNFNGMGQGRGDVGFICRPGLIRMGFPRYGESHDIGVVVKARVLREAAIEWEP